ncbi:Metal tolerance protein 1 [Asimina triloba]
MQQAFDIPIRESSLLMEPKEEIHWWTITAARYACISGADHANYISRLTFEQGLRLQSKQMEIQLSVVFFKHICLGIRFVEEQHVGSLTQRLAPKMHIRSDLKAFPCSHTMVMEVPICSPRLLLSPSLRSLYRQLVEKLIHASLYETIVKLLHDTGEARGLLILVATLGLVVNVVAALLLGHDDGHGDAHGIGNSDGCQCHGSEVGREHSGGSNGTLMNLQGAYLHVPWNSIQRGMQSYGTSRSGKSYAH